MDVIYHKIFFTIFTGPECISQTFYTMCKLLLFEQTLVMKRTIYVICIITELKVIYFRRKDRSIRLRPRRTCEQEHVPLSNAILRNSAARAKHTHDPYLSDFWLRNWL